MTTLQASSSADRRAARRLVQKATGWLAAYIRARRAEPVLRMTQGAVHRVRRPLGRTITCESGSLWLTFDHHPVDILLQAGESHRCTRASLLLIQALEVSKLRPY